MRRGKRGWWRMRRGKRGVVEDEDIYIYIYTNTHTQLLGHLLFVASKVADEQGLDEGYRVGW